MERFEWIKNLRTGQKVLTNWDEKIIDRVDVGYESLTHWYETTITDLVPSEDCTSGVLVLLAGISRDDDDWFDTQWIKPIEEPQKPLTRYTRLRVGLQVFEKYNENFDFYFGYDEMVHVCYIETTPDDTAYLLSLGWGKDKDDWIFGNNEDTLNG